MSVLAVDKVPNQHPLLGNIRAFQRDALSPIEESLVTLRPRHPIPIKLRWQGENGRRETRSFIS